jgi:hypothetical protein
MAANGMSAEGRELFTKEAVVMTKLQAYATAYTNYEECNSQNPVLVNAINTAGRLGSSGCNNETGAGGYSALTTALTNVNTAIDDWNTAKTNYGVTGKTNTAFDASMVALKRDYASMTATRANLDTKLKNLYNAENSIADMNKVELDAEIYANILWTILATSLLYVVFTKL